MLQASNKPRQRPPAGRRKRANFDIAVVGRVEICPRHHVVDHALQAEALAVRGRIEPLDAIGVELVHFLFCYNTAAAAENLDTPRAALMQQIDGIFEIFDMAALIGADGDALHILLDRGGDDFVDRAIVAEMDHFGARRLQDAPHDVDGRVMPVEQARRGHEPDLVADLAGLCGLGLLPLWNCCIAHGLLLTGNIVVILLRA